MVSRSDKVDYIIKNSIDEAIKKFNQDDNSDLNSIIARKGINKLTDEDITIIYDEIKNHHDEIKTLNKSVPFQIIEMIQFVGFFQT